MDIIFQSGEFYGSSNDFVGIITTIISSLLGALISGLIAIYIFKKGIKKEKQNEQRKEQKKLNDIETFYFHTLKSNIEPLTNQIKYNIDTIERLKERKAGSYTYKLVTSLSFESLQRLDPKDIFDMFSFGLDTTLSDYKKEHNILEKSIKQVEVFKSESHKILSFVNLKYQSYQDNFNDSVNSIQRMIEKFTHNNDLEEIPIEHDKFLSQIWMVILKWQELKEVDNRDPFVLDEFYLEPIRQICAIHHLDKRKPYVLNKILDAQHHLEQIKGIKRLFRERIIKDTRELVKIKIELKRILNLYEESKSG